MDGVNKYTCECPAEFTGKFCEIEPMVAQMYPQTSPCQQHDCTVRYVLSQLVRHSIAASISLFVFSLAADYIAESFTQQLICLTSS